MWSFQSPCDGSFPPLASRRAVATPPPCPPALPSPRPSCGSPRRRWPCWECRLGAGELRKGRRYDGLWWWVGWGIGMQQQARGAGRGLVLLSCRKGPAWAVQLLSVLVCSRWSGLVLRACDWWQGTSASCCRWTGGPGEEGGIGILLFRTAPHVNTWRGLRGESMNL